MGSHSAREIWQAAQHPRGVRGRFTDTGQVDRQAHPDAVRGGRLEMKVSSPKPGSRRLELNDAGPLSSREGPLWFKQGRTATPSRFRGGRKSTTKFNTSALDVVDGKFQEVKLPRRKTYWGTR
jgi:hypothetical protein